MYARVFKSYFICIIFINLHLILGCGREEIPKKIENKPLPEIPTRSPNKDLPPKQPEVEDPDKVPSIENPHIPREESPSFNASCVRANVDMTKDGSYPVVQRRMGLIVVYEPQVRSCSKPIYSHANGTRATTPYYRTQLRRFASHGYLAVAYETTNSGSGSQQMRAVDYALSRPDTAPMLVSAGHSQGGSAAAIVHYLAQRKYGDRLKIVSVLEQPAFGMNRATWRREVSQLKGSTFVINGSADTLVSRAWISSGARLLRNDYSWYTAVGATHFNVQPWAASGGLIYANCKLFDYESACRQFTVRMPMSRYWSPVKR